jgi:hypothetical protein
VRHRNSVFHDLLKLVPWAAFDKLADDYGTDAAARSFTSRQHLTALLFAQLSGASSLREIEATMASHQGRLYHCGAVAPKRSTFADANRARDFRVFSGLFEAMLAGASRGFRRKMSEAVRLIDSTGLRLAGVGAEWARFSTSVFGAKAHVVYDPDLGRPVYHAVSPRMVLLIADARAHGLSSIGGQQPLRPSSSIGRKRTKRLVSWQRSGRRTDDRFSVGGRHRPGRKLRSRSESRRLARLSPTAVHHRRQAKAFGHQQARQQIPSQVTDPGRPSGAALCRQARHAARPMGQRALGTRPSQCCCRCLRRQRLSLRPFIYLEFAFEFSLVSAHKQQAVDFIVGIVVFVCARPGGFG